MRVAADGDAVAVNVVLDGAEFRIDGDQRRIEGVHVHRVAEVDVPGCEGWALAAAPAALGSGDEERPVSLEAESLRHCRGQRAFGGRRPRAEVDVDGGAGGQCAGGCEGEPAAFFGVVYQPAHAVEFVFGGQAHGDRLGAGAYLDQFEHGAGIDALIKRRKERRRQRLRAARRVNTF